MIHLLLRYAPETLSTIVTMHFQQQQPFQQQYSPQQQQYSSQQQYQFFQMDYQMYVRVRSNTILNFRKNM